MNDLHFFSAVSGEIHEMFIVPFIASALIVHPGATAEVLVEDIDDYLKRNSESYASLKDVFGCRFCIRDWSLVFRFDKWKRQPCRGAYIRLIEDPIYSREYAYISDIDMLFVRPILDEHLRLMNETGLPYTNIVRPGTRRLTGCMMVRSKEYYDAIEPVLAEYKQNPESLYWPIFNDEELLYRLVERSGLNLPTQDDFSYRPILSIHTSIHREIFSDPGWGCSDTKLKWAARLFEVPEWRKIVFSPGYHEILSQLEKAIREL